MARPKKVKYEIEQRYLDEALRLAKSYPELLCEKVEIEKRLKDKDNIYTEDMAIADLLGGGVSYDTERVQTSNISKPAERVAVLLADGYVEKHREEIRSEMELRYKRICEEICIVETAVAERMEERTQAVSRQIFVERKSYKKVRYTNKSGFCYDEIIKREKEKAVIAIAQILMLNEFFEQEENNGQTKEENL